MKLNKLFFSILMLLGLAITNSLQAQKLIISNYKELTTDISAREHEVLDVNDEPCALIKIYTGFLSLKIDGNRGVEKTQQHPGALWVWVGQGTRQIKISLEGYPMAPHYFTEELKSSTVYSIELTSDQVYSITINTYEIEADVTLNDKKYKSNKPIENLAEGKYPILITKIGYKPITDTISVSSKDIFFSYKLERTKQSVMKINSTPTNSLILIDGEVVGNSPHTGFYFPGEYKVQISQTDYATLDTIIMFDPERSAEFNLKLRKNVGWISISTYPLDAIVSIDGKPITTKITKLNADKNHEIEVKKEYYRDFNEAFKINQNDTLVKIISLKLADGQLSFITDPQNTQVTIVDRHKEKRTWLGNTVIDLPTGLYELEAKVKGYYTTDTTFTISKDKKEYLTYNMVPRKFSYAVAGAYSMLLPGAGQLYTQRKIVGSAFMATTLAMAGATAFMYMQTEDQAIVYTQAQEKYKNAVAISDIESARTDMDEAYNDHQKMAQQRDMLLYATVGLYVLNVVDAIVFAKHYDPKRPKKDVSDNLNFNFGPSANLKSANFYMSYKF